VLFQIDPRPYRAALDQALAALARDRAQAANAAQDVKRYEALVQKQYVTQQQYDQVRTPLQRPRRRWPGARRPWTRRG